MPLPRVLLLLPTSWDRRQLQACEARWRDRCAIVFTDPSDEDCPSEFDHEAFLDGCAAENPDGVTSSSDYPGATLAAALATRLGIPGARPEKVIGTSHKYYSRLIQAAAVPEATPRFALIDPAAERYDVPFFPCFVKPVKGAFSIMSGKIRSPEELETFLRRPQVDEFLTEYIGIFNRLVRAFTEFEYDGRYFLAEEVLHGSLVTVEGYAFDGAVSILGIVDSVTDKATGSFLKFEYPSRLPEQIRQRMGHLTERVVQALGLTNTMFNIEMIYDAQSDHIGIIEVNPRLCGQFADLYEKVDGTNGYEVALSLALGEAPRVTRGAGGFTCAASFPLRTFEPVHVDRVPDRARLVEAERAFPGTLTWIECAAGQTFDDFVSNEDGFSARYGVVNLGANAPAELDAHLNAVRDILDIGLTPIST